MPTADRRAAVLTPMLAALSIVLGLLAARFDTFPGDPWIADRLRSLGGTFAPVAAVFNQGDVVIVGLALGLAVALAIRRWRFDALVVVAVAAVARVVLIVPRELVDRPRPAGDVVARVAAGGPSFPSGHVMTALLAFGCWYVLAPALLPERWVRPVRVACALAVALTAIARVWAGVHWPSDTIGAVVWMGGALALAAAVRAPLERGLVRRAR